MDIHINSHGVSLRIKDGLLSIKKKDQIQQVPIGKVKTISLTRGVSVSTDVMYQCLDLGIDLLIIERNGYPVGRIWNNRFGSISTIRKSQIDFSKGDRVLPWIIENMKEKFINQQELLMTFMSLSKPDNELIYKTCSELDTLIVRLDTSLELPIDDAKSRIRALEGQVAKKYFKCINAHLPFRYQFSKRSKRPALDITNSMLNYCYGILYGQIESALIKAGIDPFIGFFHRDEYNRPVLTYDVIEPFRPWSDWVVFHLCLNEILDETFFEVSEGGYWLRGDGKRILIQHYVDFFSEIIDYQNTHFSRLNHLEKRAQKLAQLINV